MTTPSGPDAAGAPELRSWLPSFLLLASIWGTSFLFIKVGVRELHPLWLTFGRVVAGMATLLLILVATRDRLPRDLRLWGHLAVTAALGVAIPFTLFGFGEQRVSSVLAGIWNATTPLVALPLVVLAGVAVSQDTLRRLRAARRTPTAVVEAPAADAPESLSAPTGGDRAAHRPPVAGGPARPEVSGGSPSR